MLPLPIHLRYSLTRRQRLVGLYDEWGWFAPLMAVPFLAFLVLRAGWSAWTLEWAAISLFGGLALGVIVLYAGLFGGLIDLMLVRVRQMDVTIEDGGAGPAVGVLLGGERWYLFLDGITSIRRRRDLWIVRHYNGLVLWIPASAVTGEQVELLRDWMRRGQTPEGFQAVIERGRRVEHLAATEPDQR
jgi:hypothetical protein